MGKRQHKHMREYNKMTSHKDEKREEFWEILCFKNSVIKNGRKSMKWKIERKEKKEVEKYNIKGEKNSL